MTNNRSLKKFCRLTKYIEQTDSNLYQAIEDLCIGHYFKPSRDASGVTFLYPADKAYRQRIINAAYSTDPDVAVNMIKSLLVHGFYHGCKDFSGDVVNLLNQKLEIESADDKQVKLANGLILKKDETFVPMSYRENMAVYTLSGKGEIPLNGQSVTVERKKKGGDLCLSSKKSDLQKLLEHRYVNEIGVVDNIYVKKVRLHLKLLVEKRNLSNSELSNYLGNDEFSDSYLLDMYCSKHCPSCFDTLYKSLQQQDARAESITFDAYIAAKKQIVGAEPTNKNVTRDSSILKGLHSPMDVRTRVCDLYKHDKQKLGKDLFIVFCNISKDLWQTSAFDKVDEFKNFAYIAAKIYTKPEDLVNQEFDPARDLTLYGNLLKSDVLHYVPQADFRDSSSVSLKIVSQLPSPLEMTLFSLCHLATMTKKVGGGSDPEIEALLKGL
jgi:hypothetical protein